FRGFLQKLKTFHGLDENGQPVALPESLAGYDNPTALSLLLGKSGTPGEIEKLGNALLVEASVAFWVRPRAVTKGQFNSFQYLPSGAQRAMLTSLADLDTTPEGTPQDQQRPWYLLTLPFLGRLQPKAKDADNTGSTLAIDPIKTLQAAQQGSSI